MSALEIIKAAAARASLSSRSAQRDVAGQSQFEKDFAIVAEHFHLRENHEYEQAIEAAKADKAQAKICYSAIAASLRREGLEVGINERIRIRIAVDKESEG